ncbi:SDR family NAD(P)-dependent oxidoreductase [Halalkalicoccus jeotgali]|uniref:Short-chain dehydrogenase/reductase SDR n=1 Tax=Halalkalicoccus jeotgali (strain DSM 18796 / CECT 7217 / JCM 14584 / KCTC 4019 / B3) TaxID=795797 RepID=D8J8J9_HALJB|nr:SDR family oxidoreductase [Halalkalicoccus jeotgali]ADJ16245.1 short-chain dehydrogenase/reductase SDR [Halalkalicoccus jeotgali B3]ELY36980.1 short-chain dehydrogenase/reductase SDR [Halalkalicoccus jeotgali B3]
MGDVHFDFADETVIVTGGSSGIGRAIALGFGNAGATVIVADQREEPKDPDAQLPTHEAIEESGGEAEFVETDVADPEQVRSVVEAARDYGGVDVMANNAGVFVGGSFVDYDSKDLDTGYEVNVRGMFVGTQAAASDMIERGVEGSIVNTASISSNLAQHGQVAYDTTKGALRMLTRGAALELASEGIRVNATAPGQIATEFTENGTESTQERAGDGEFLKPIPMGRAGFPEDVADATLYLASDAAGYTTGELLSVDGGWQIA